MTKSELESLLRRGRFLSIKKNYNRTARGYVFELRIATTEYKTHRGYWRTRKVFWHKDLGPVVDEAVKIRGHNACGIECWVVGTGDDEKMFFERDKAFELAKTLNAQDPWSVISDRNMPIERYLEKHRCPA